MWFTVKVQSLVLLLVLSVAYVVGFVNGQPSSAARSVWLGGLVALLPNAVFALYLTIKRSAAVHRFFLGEGIKMGLALIGATLVWREYGFEVSPVWYWVAFILVLKAHNFGLLRTVK